MSAELQKGYYNSPRWTWEILDCAMPMTFDTYSNCAHQCVYCFAYFQRAVGHARDDYLAHKVSSVNVERVKQMFTDPDRHAGQFAWYIKGRYVLQWGGLSDGFDWYERTFRKSLELLRFFREIDYPISISTKGTWFVDDPEYREAFRDAKNVHMKYSIVTTDDEMASIVEKGCPSPAKRFEALRKLKELGVGVTTIRFRPYILGVSDKTVETICQEAEKAGCYSLTTEFLCLESRASNHARERYDRISKACGFDVFPFYRRHSAINTGLLRLNYEVKRPHIERLRDLCAKHGLKFFVSDAHHKEASEGTGCCGLPDEGPLSNINRGQYSEAMQIAKRHGRVRWADIAGFAEPLKQVGFYGAEGFNIGTTRTKAVRIYQSMFDYMQDVWNNPRLGMSPARYFGGVLVPSGTDEDGNVVYLYNEPQVKGDPERVKTSAALRQIVYGAKEKLRADGASHGHVAFPIYILPGVAGYGDCPNLFTEARLSPIYCARPGAAATLPETLGVSCDVVEAVTKEEAIAAAKEAGMEWFWVVESEQFKPPQGSARAYLSLIEGRMEPCEVPGASLVCL